jgi:hypothetical protein
VSDLIRFACPSCGHPFSTGAQVVGMKVACPECKKPFIAEIQDPLKIRSGESLGRAYSRIVNALEADKADLHPMKGFNDHSPCAEFAKFMVSRSETEAPEVFVLGTKPWDVPQEQSIVQQLMTMWDAFQRKGEGLPRVRLLTPAEIPSSLGYLFSNEEPGAFETLCMLKFRATYAVDPTFAREISDHVRWILKTYWDMDIDIGNPRSARTIEEFIVKTIRGNTGPDDTIEGLEFWPRHSLLGLGCVVGELLCRHPDLTGRWIEDEEVPFQLGIEVGLRGSSRVQYSDPIGRVCMLFEDGMANSVSQYVRTMPKALGDLEDQSED